jgi:cytoskeletal protein RodZ
MAFGHYLRRQREEREMTLTELARRWKSPSRTYRASSANVRTRRQIT